MDRHHHGRQPGRPRWLIYSVYFAADTHDRTGFAGLGRRNAEGRASRAPMWFALFVSLVNLRASTSCLYPASAARGRAEMVQGGELESRSRTESDFGLAPTTGAEADSRNSRKTRADGVRPARLRPQLRRLPRYDGGLTLTSRTSRTTHASGRGRGADRTVVFGTDRHAVMVGWLRCSGKTARRPTHRLPCVVSGPAENHAGQTA